MKNTMPKFAKIYTDIKKVSDNYYHVTFEEYVKIGDDIKLHRTGVEDFTKDRLTKQTLNVWVYAYNGRINKAGGRMTNHVDDIRISKNSDIPKIQLARLKFDNVARVN